MINKKSLLLTIILTCFLSITTFANIFDTADLLTDDETKSLISKSRRINSVGDVSIMITTDPIENTGKTREVYIEDIYNGKNYSNGVVLHIDMHERNFYIQSFGQTQQLISSSEIDKLLDLIEVELVNGNFNQACQIFLDNIDSLYKGKSVKTATSSALTNMILSFSVFLATSISIYVLIKKSYATEGSEKPYPFNEKAKASLKSRDDRFLREFTTKVVLSTPRNNRRNRTPDVSSRQRRRSSSSRSRRF